MNSSLSCGPIATAPYLKVNTQPIKSSLTVVMGGRGMTFSYVIHREIFGNLPKYIQIACCLYEGVVKTKLSNYIIKRAWIKLSIPFKIFKSLH
jgi:hypothetical protein